MSTSNRGFHEGPRHDGKTAPELATAAGESLRAIVHLIEATDVALDAQAVFGALSGTARMLDYVSEVVTRLRAVVLDAHQQGRLVISTGPFRGDPAAAVTALTDSVDAVLPALGPVIAGMDKAQATLSGASFETPDS